MNEWIQFQATNRDEPPINGLLWVEIMMLDGEVWQEFAFELNWSVIDEPGEIIAYRLPKLTNIENSISIKEKVND